MKQIENVNPFDKHLFLCVWFVFRGSAKFSVIWNLKWLLKVLSIFKLKGDSSALFYLLSTFLLGRLELLALLGLLESAAALHLHSWVPGSLSAELPHTHMFTSKSESSKLCSCQCCIFLFILNPGQICPFRSFRSFIEHGRISNFIFRSIYTFKILPSDVGYFQAMIELCKS